MAQAAVLAFVAVALGLSTLGAKGSGRPARGPVGGLRGLVGLLALSLLALGGCGSDGEPAGTSGSEGRGVAVLEIETPLQSPIWSPDEKAVFALGQHGRQLVKVDVTGGGFEPDEQRPEAIASSQGLEGTAGENLALKKDREPDKVYVPVPGRDEVHVLGKDDLVEVRTVEVGESPSRVALGRSAGTLFALSEDGSTVTAVDLLAEKEVLAEVRTNAGENALIETGAGDGFWVAGPETVAFFGGSSFGRRASAEGLGASALAADASQPGRAYVAEAGGAGRVVALEPAEGDNLQVVAEAQVDGPVTHLAAEKGRLYAVTPGRIVTLDPESLQARETVNFDESLGREALKRADPSGVAVGENHLYLTLKGEPVLVQIKKP